MLSETGRMEKPGTVWLHAHVEHRAESSRRSKSSRAVSSVVLGGGLRVWGWGGEGGRGLTHVGTEGGLIWVMSTQHSTRARSNCAPGTWAVFSNQCHPQ